MGSDKIRNHPLLLASGYQNIHTDAVLQIAATITRDLYQLAEIVCFINCMKVESKETKILCFRHK